ncbi:MAG: hypothetical protein MZV70_44725 [Desulfobacterales bacterium]|nr:hypothetical protein [Desulfobacterales bacterium]
MVVAACSPKTHAADFHGHPRGLRAEQVPLRDGQHPQPGLLGARQRPRGGHRARPRIWCGWRRPAPPR